MTAAIVAMVVLVVAGMAMWRRAVPLVLLLTVFEGALRKWAFPDHAQLIYLAKDALLIGAYTGFLLPRVVRRQRLGRPHPAVWPLVLFAVIGLAELLNPALPNLAVGLFGFRAYLIYVPLLYLGPATFESVGSLRRFLVVFVLLGVVPLVLGVIQFWSPPDSVLNRYAWEEELAPGVATFGEAGHVRITGTFSYITGHTAFLTLAVLVGLGLATRERRRGLRWALAGVLALAFANLLMTGSRGPFIVLGVAVPAVLALSGVGRLRAWLPRFAAGSLGVVAAGVAAVLGFPDAVAAFLERVESTEDLADRIVGVVREPIWALGEAGLGGYGIGVTHQATSFLVADWPEPPPAAEGEWQRIILEVGPVGFGAVMLTRLLVVARAWRAWRACADPDARPILAAALLVVVAGLPGNLVFNHTASVFYWFMAGIPLVAERDDRLPSRAGGRG